MQSERKTPKHKREGGPRQDVLWGNPDNDHTSSQIQVYHQVSLGTSDTIRSKQQYELEAEAAGVKILSYRGDNGVYKSKDFKVELAKRGQTMSYSGVGIYQ